MRPSVALGSREKGYGKGKKNDKNAPRSAVLKRLRNHQKKIASQGKGQPQQQKAVEEEMGRKKK